MKGQRKSKNGKHEKRVVERDREKHRGNRQREREKERKMGSESVYTCNKNGTIRGK